MGDLNFNVNVLLLSFLLAAVIRMRVATGAYCAIDRYLVTSRRNVTFFKLCPGSMVGSLKNSLKFHVADGSPTRVSHRDVSFTGTEIAELTL